jgi:aspartyl protease family protein
MFRIFFFVLGLMVASVFVVQSLHEGGAGATNKTAAKQAPQQRRAYPRRVVIASRRGHYVTDARIDGREARFMVDTGATVVAIRESDAWDLGYRPSPNDYVVRITTANGVGRGAPVELRRVEVGNLVVRDVPALILRDEALDINLLGMSFLSKVRWRQQDGELILEE